MIVLLLLCSLCRINNSYSELINLLFAVQWRGQSLPPTPGSERAQPARAQELLHLFAYYELLINLAAEDKLQLAESLQHDDGDKWCAPRR